MDESNTDEEDGTKGGAKWVVVVVKEPLLVH
jgi:hypothetical protein